MHHTTLFDSSTISHCDCIYFLFIPSASPCFACKDYLLPATFLRVGEDNPNRALFRLFCGCLIWRTSPTWGALLSFSLLIFNAEASVLDMDKRLAAPTCFWGNCNKPSTPSTSKFRDMYNDFRQSWIARTGIDDDLFYYILYPCPTTVLTKSNALKRGKNDLRFWDEGD